MLYPLQEKASRIYINDVYCVLSNNVLDKHKTAIIGFGVKVKLPYINLIKCIISKTCNFFITLGCSHIDEDASNEVHHCGCHVTYDHSHCIVCRSI